MDLDRSRAGLDSLLARFPEAIVVGVGHQELAHQFIQSRHGPDHLAAFMNPGPWTEVTLFFRSPTVQFREFAIWNRTGAVHTMVGGAVEDPALIEGNTE